MFDIEKYNFNLDKKFIRTHPLAVADEAKLLIYDTSHGIITHEHFFNLSNYLSNRYYIYRNTTKVTPARIMAHSVARNKKVELLLMTNERFESGSIRAMVNTRVDLGDELIIVNSLQGFGLKNIYKFKAIEQSKSIFTFKHIYSYQEILDLLYALGSTPLPKYITKISDNMSEDQKRMEYNSIFAALDGSIAAPTASLHFTPRVIDSLLSKDIQIFDINLNIGLGTFAPIDEANFIHKKLHQEYYFIPEKTAQSLGSNNLKLAIGTTTVRALESWYNSKISNTWLDTSIFIFDNYQFQYTDALLTNFHLPKSSLMCLVDSFLKYKKAPHNIIDLYQEAIDHNYYFYSFGDAMLII